MPIDADVIVVGAGIVGLATAWQVMQRFPTLSLAIIDKEREVAVHQTGRNSGVIHSGIYYHSGSLKAALCMRGRTQLLDFLRAHEIPFELSGKVIVARSAEELPRLHRLFEQGQSNGVKGLQLVDTTSLHLLEPEADGLAAIYSPGTGIVDYRQVAQAMANDLTRAGHALLLGRKVDRIRDDRQGVSLCCDGQPTLRARFAIVAAGLYSDVLAWRSGECRNPRIVPFRGEYWQIRPGRESLVRSMIYPVPDPEFPFLGVHFTRRLADGTVWIGPNAVLGLSREHYQRHVVAGTRLSELCDTLTYPGFWRMASRYWRAGMAELYRSLVPQAYIQLARQYVPRLLPEDVLPGSVGVRAQTVDVSGAMSDDFLITTSHRALFVRNAPSPAATASLAIGEYIVGSAQEAFSW